MSDAILETFGLTKRFGGLAAVDDVSLTVAEREVHAVIGPNGAGKSTLSDLLTGEQRASSGKILFRGRDITNLTANRKSGLGVGRSFQRTNIFPTFTCLENCALTAQSRLKHSFRFFRRAESYRSVQQRAERALARCGLGHLHATRADAMSHGEQRQLEIAMVLATEPSFMVLDEPMAGMGSNESAHVVSLLKELAQEYSILLVEHDMDAVFSIADRLTVMVDGQVLASGALNDVRNDPAVQEAYLGDGEASC